MDIAACRAVLRLVGALHAQGHQRLRIAPTVSETDGTWQCVIAASRSFSAGGVVLVDHGGPAVHYGSDQGHACFGWHDAVDASPERLADMFVARFPTVAGAGWGPDWAYAGWFLELLRLTAPDDLPVAHAEGLATLRRPGCAVPLPIDGAFPWEDLEGYRTRGRELRRAAARLDGALAAYAGYTEAARREMLTDLGPDARGLEPWESLDVLRHVLRGGWCEEVEGAEALRLPGQIPDAWT
jgi:hypothetical protein